MILGHYLQGSIFSEVKNLTDMKKKQPKDKNKEVDDMTRKSLETGRMAIKISVELEKKSGSPNAEEMERKDAAKWRNEG